MLSNYNKLSDARSAKIIRRLLQARDKSGLSLLYEHYGPALFRILSERIPQKEVAKEALQDVLMKIWENIEKYDDKKGRFFTWMARIAKNYAIDVLRSKNINRERNRMPCLITYIMTVRSVKKIIFRIQA